MLHAVALRRVLAPRARAFTTSAAALEEAASSTSSRGPSRGGRPGPNAYSGNQSRPQRGGARNGGQQNMGVRRTRGPSVLSRGPRGGEQEASPARPQKQERMSVLTDWNNPRYARSGFERVLAPPPTQFVFDPDVAAEHLRNRPPEQVKAPAAAPAKAPVKGKKGAPAPKAAATAPAPVVEKPAAVVVPPGSRLPKHKDAMRALTLRIMRSGGARTGVRAPARKDDTPRPLLDEIKHARRVAQNEQQGGDYSRYLPDAVLAAARAHATPHHPTVVHTATQAAAQNPDLAPEAKAYLVNAIATRLAPKKQ